MSDMYWLVDKGMDFESGLHSCTTDNDILELVNTIFFGRQIKWKKNDAIRARAICKQNGCEQEIFCGVNKMRKSFK